MRKIVFLILFLIGYFSVTAQHSAPVRSELFTINPSAKISLKNISHHWDPQLLNFEMPAPGSGSYQRYLIDLKNELYGDPHQSDNHAFKTNETSSLSEPAILAGWEGNIMGNSVPNDNDMAISNEGKIISVINSIIYFYNSDGSLLSTVSLFDFADTLGIADSKYDPKVMYDPRADKFIIVFLSGFTPGSTNIIIAFSETNDPLGNWNFYSLPGNPKDNDRWTDFPMLALTEHELFITGNLIIPDEPWQTGFSETLIWQMSLDSGYIAAPINAVYYDSIFFGGFPVRNLNPVRGGETTYGPDMYFLSNRNFSPTNDTIFIVHITGTLDNPETGITVDYSLADINYGVPPQARQDNSHIFDTNDGRVLGSYYEDGEIQFVSNTIDPATGFCGIYHGIITDLDGAKNIQGHIIGDDTLDFGYPNISYTGKFEGDNQSIITFDHTAPTVYAGMSAVFYNWGDYSSTVNIKTGDTYVNILSGTYERWGDYTGSQRKYNEPGVVWVSGNFGKFIDGFPYVQRNNATWIAELKSTVEPNVSNAGIEINNQSAVYPNPMQDYFSTEFELPASGSIQFRIYDMQGNLVKYLLNAKAKEGKNRFTFSTQELASGNYLLDIILNGEHFDTKSIVRL